MKKFESFLKEEGCVRKLDKTFEKGKNTIQKFVFDFKSEENTGRDCAKTCYKKEVQSTVPKSFSNTTPSAKVTRFTVKELIWAYSKYMSEKMQEQEYKNAEEQLENSQLIVIRQGV